MNITEALKQLGLDDKEVSVYTGLLELGEASVLTISKKTGVKRPTAYLVLNALEGRGLVSRTIKAGKTLFTAQHPKTILTEAELRVKQLQDVIPQFEAMMHRSDDRPRVKIYEGKEALDRAYDDSFVIKGEQLFMSNMDIVHDVFPRTLQKIDYATLSPAYRVRELLADGATSRKYAARVSGAYRQTRFIPAAFSPFATDIGIFGNNTIITSGKKEFFSVRIESEEVTSAFRMMFEAMWQISGDPKNPPGVAQ
ncbi:helix-turn-helix domain-containing protein [Candidatus Kaiserbacteria bacterium]|nr:helix-turn-helix domain-containing protein [Candidatus Kaiserbacteria bacterium]